MEFLKNLASLLKVKTIVTLVVIGVFAALALRGDIVPDDVSLWHMTLCGIRECLGRLSSMLV